MKFKSQHTKGNWHAVGTWVEHEDDSTPDICNCNTKSMDQDHLNRSYAEMTANAKLLAAAPTMFKLLLEIANHPDADIPLRENAKAILGKICH